MLHLNSGLLLRHAGESGYALARRFACANASLGYAGLAREYNSWQLNAPEPHYSSQPLLLQLALHVEDIHCRQYGLPRSVYAPLLTSSSASNSIARNCPQCARDVFHSPLYELPWLSHCPIHRCPITDCCPSCGHGWPRLYQMWSRRCATCGVHLNREALIDAVSRTKKWALDDFALLQRAIDQHRAWASSYLWEGDDRRVNPFDIYVRKPIHALDACFPSVISCIDSDFRDYCLANHIAVETCFRFSFSCAAYIDHPKRHHTIEPLPNWALVCRRQVAAKISAAVARCAGPSHQLTPPSQARDLPPRCPFVRRICFGISYSNLRFPPVRKREERKWSYASGTAIDR